VPPPRGPELARSITTDTGIMVLVPAGPFLFGEKKGSFTLPAFYIDKTEVTNQAYAAFCDATSHERPSGFPADKPGLPVVNINILDAKAFATWAHKRLPTAKEWEKAARGTDGRIFPWGDQKDETKANVGTKSLRPATDFADGASPSGALNMLGNVWELVEELSTPTEATKENFKKQTNYQARPDELWYTMRGLSFADPWSDAPNGLWDSAMVPAGWKLPNIGFRCVKDAVIDSSHP